MHFEMFVFTTCEYVHVGDPAKALYAHKTKLDAMKEKEEGKKAIA